MENKSLVSVIPTVSLLVTLKQTINTPYSAHDANKLPSETHIVTALYRIEKELFSKYQHRVGRFVDPILARKHKQYRILQPLDILTGITK